MRLIGLGYVLLLGAGLGLGSAHLAVAERPLVGKVTIGPWSLWPQGGAKDADPYMRAFLSRGPHLPLATGEGIDLLAERDADGLPLNGRCRYLVAGKLPSVRAWTLTVADRGDRPRAAKVALTYAEIVRRENEPMQISVSARPEPGNWLPVDEAARFSLRLRLYDTPFSGQASSLRADQLPSVSRVGCG